MQKNRAITLIGINDDGCLSLSSKMVNAVAGCQILAGGERHLEFFPQFKGEKVVLKAGLAAKIDSLVELAAENNICILASGDPMFFGLGALVCQKAGVDNVAILPQPSSIQFAFARTGLKWNDAKLISLHGRPREGFITRIKRYSKIGCLTDRKNSPDKMAEYMLEFGENGWHSWVCENLSGVDERVRFFDNLEKLAQCSDLAELNVWILVRADQNWNPPPVIQNLYEDQFSKRLPRKGLITKKEVRLLTIGELQIRKNSTVWDIGAASGSISIASALLAYEGKIYAIEMDLKSIRCCRENLQHFAVDNVELIEGEAPQIFNRITADPDAVFVGGSQGNLKAIIQSSYQRLKAGGRLVVNAITLENIQIAYQVFKELKIQPDLTQVNISRGVPLTKYLRYEAQNPVHIFSISKP